MSVWGTEQLVMYAARRDVVDGLIGLGLRDHERAERHWRWALRYGSQTAWAGTSTLVASLRTLLWHGDDRYPLDSDPDVTWYTFQALVASVARSVLAPRGLSVAVDLDALFQDADIDPAQFPTAISQRYDVGFPPAVYVDARIIPHDDVLRLAEIYAVTSERETDVIRDWLQNFSLPMLKPCDLWIFSPGLDTLVRRPGVEDPPASA